MPNWFAFLSYVSIAAFTPGPNNVTCMNNGIKIGLRKSIGYNFGVWIGYGLMNLATALFGAGLYASFPAAKPYIQWVGAGYLVWLAWQVFRSSHNSKEAGIVPHTFWPSFFIQFINVKAIFFALTTNSTFVVPYFKGFWVLFLVSFGISFISFISTIVWTLFGSLFEGFLTRHEKLSNALMALLLLYSALMLFL